MAAKKKKAKAKRKAPAKRKAKATRKTKAKRAPKKRAASGDKFSALTAAHARAVASGEHHFAQLLKRELTKGGKRKGRR